jgi:hypothetical protein
MKNPRNAAWQIVDENLKGFYPNWSSYAVQIVTNCLFRRFNVLIKQDVFAVADIVIEGVFILNKRHQNGIILSTYWLNPRFHLELARVYEKQKGGLNSVEEGYFNQIIQEENINPNENYKNISLYADEIIEKETLTTKESELFLLMIEISLAELEGEFYKNLNKVAVELGLTEKDTNFRKAYQRLREKLLNKDNKGSLNLLIYATGENINKDSVIADFFKYLDSQFIMENHLQAYRFSEQEINKMIYLKKIFEENGFEINRFPEVYYDNYDNYIEIYGKLKGNYDEIDFLGVYTDFTIAGDEKNTKEGVIVLFKDRIENHKLDTNNVCFVVLMHELGHWLSHWPKCNNENWSNGYSADNPKTHESFAQLIAYWALDGNPELEKTLTNLTPTDIENPYYLYNNLKGFSKTDILTKLVEIRKHYFLSDDLTRMDLINEHGRVADDLYYDFLANNEISLFNSFISKFNNDKEILINSPINLDVTDSSYNLDKAQVKFYSELLLEILPNDETIIYTTNFPVIIAHKLYKLGVFNNNERIKKIVAEQYKGYLVGSKFGL